MIVILTFMALAVFGELVFPASANAWGPGVHTATVIYVLKAATGLMPAVAEVILSYPRQFLYGCLAADFFKQRWKTVESAHPHSWEGGDIFLQEANDDSERAFAYGFLAHLAADVIAHNFFIPCLIQNYPTARRMGHIYWEMRADQLMGPSCLQEARAVLSSNQKSYDKLLVSVAGKGENAVEVVKHLYAQSVTLSRCWCVAKGFLLSDREPGAPSFHHFVQFMVDLSSCAVVDQLNRLERSECRLFNPCGQGNLHAPNKGPWIRRLFQSHPLTRVFQKPMGKRFFYE